MSKICPFMSQGAILSNCIMIACQLWDEKREDCGVKCISIPFSHQPQMNIKESPPPATSFKPFKKKGRPRKYS